MICGNYILEHFENSNQCTDTIKNLAALYISFANENYNRWSALFEFNLPQNTPLPDWYSDKIKELFLIIEAPLLPLMKEKQKKTLKEWLKLYGPVYMASANCG